MTYLHAANDIGAVGVPVRTLDGLVRAIETYAPMMGTATWWCSPERFARPPQEEAQ